METNKVYKNVSLTKFNSWKVGGKAENFVICSDISFLCQLIKNKKVHRPIKFIGLGSNILVRDNGVKGTTIVMHKGLNNFFKEEELFYSDDYSRAKGARDDAARSASFFECYVFQTKTATPRYRAFSSSRFDTKSLLQNGGQTRASREENIKEKEGAQKLFSVPGIFSSRGRTL